MDSKEIKRRKVVIQSYKLKELADIYKISKYLMRSLIAKHKKAIGKREGYFFRSEQVAKIFLLIKPPSDVDII